MTLQLKKGSPYKAYVKKLENGFGIKTINTLTGIENIIVITTDSMKGSHCGKKIINSQSQIFRPILSKFSEDTICATMSIPSITKPNFSVNSELAHLEPYLRKIKPDITGFHIFEDGNTISFPNVQKTSVIFVANTELARKKSVHFNIPGKLMNVFIVDGQSIDGKIKFEADSIVKPLTIVVSDYVLHINICYDSPNKTQNKTVGTQTKKRYILSSVLDDNKPVYKIDSLLLSDLQVTPQQKFTQTDGNVLTEELQSSQINRHKNHRDSSIQTVFIKDQISNESMTSDKNSYSFRDELGLNVDKENTNTESFEYNSKQSIDLENPLNLSISYDSHAHLHQTTLLKHEKGGKVSKMSSIENREVKEYTKNPTQSDENKEKNTLTLFDNTSYYSTKTTSSNNAFKNIELKSSSNSIVCASSKSTSFEEGQSETSVKTADSNIGLRSTERNSKLSMKDIKERLNKTTSSLQQLYSVIDMLEKNNDNRSISETFQTGDCIENELLQNKMDVPRQTSTVLTSQATLEESPSINNSNQSVYFMGPRIRSIESNTTTDSEKSLKDYTVKSSLDILCERCGSFHTDISINGDCEIFNRKNVKLLENKSSQDTIRSGSFPISEVDEEHFSTNIKSVSAIENIQLDETESCRNSEQFSNKKESSLETKDKGFKILCKEYKETDLLDTDKDYQNKGALSGRTEPHKTVDHSEERIKMLLNHNKKYTLNKNEKQDRSDIRKMSEETSISKKECELSENFDLELTDFDKAVLKDNQSSYLTLREGKGSSNHTISSNGNYISEECIESTAESNDSNQTVVTVEEILEENTRRVKILEMGDTKKIEESYNDHKLNNSNTTSLRNENSKQAFSSEVRFTKSETSLVRKSSISINYNEKIELKEKITNNSESTTNHLKLNNLSTGDHLQESTFCKVSSNLKERLNTIGLFDNKSNFLIKKHSSVSTLHIVPSSLELLTLNSQETNLQDRECLEKSAGKVGKPSSLEKCFVKSLEKSKKKDGNLVSNLKNSHYIENKLVANKTHFDSINKSKTASVFTQNKYSKYKKQKTKQKKHRLFCFLI